jgi:hypothetical protein
MEAARVYLKSRPICNRDILAFEVFLFGLDAATRDMLLWKVVKRETAMRSTAAAQPGSRYRRVYNSFLFSSFRRMANRMLIRKGASYGKIW